MAKIGEAERWFVRLLDPDATSEERTAFEHWRSADEGRAASYREVEHLWDMSNAAVRDDPALSLAAQQALHSPKSPPKFRRWTIPVSAAAAVVVVLTLALVFVPDWLGRLNAPAGVVYDTAVGQQRTVALADGSTIVLDTSSKVRVQYNASERRVDLLHGRAQFSVRGNRQRPFVVHVGDGTITDVGTKFQVRLDGDQVGITLLAGRLSITTLADGETRRATLVSRQQLHYNRATGFIEPVRPADMMLARGWTHGKLFVHDWPLPRLLAAMNRYSTNQVVIGDAALRHLRISGVFHTGDQKTLVQTLEKGWQIRATRSAPNRTVLWHR